MWTATGDDVNIGQALEYELRISDDKSVLLNNFSAADSLDIATANFTPNVAGEIEYVRIEVDAEESYTSTMFFGVRAKDDSGNVGEVSNIISILVANGYRIRITEGELVYSYSDEAIEESVKQDEQKKSLIGLAVGLSSAAAVIIFAAIAVVVCMKIIKGKKSVEDCELGSRASTTMVFTLENLPEAMSSRQIAVRPMASQLQTTLGTEQSWEEALFSPVPLFPYPREPFDIISQGGCSIEMLNVHDTAFAEQTDANSNSDSKSLTSEQTRNIEGTCDENLASENYPEADSEFLPGEATATQLDDKESKCKFLSQSEDMPGDSLQNADDFSKESNTPTAENPDHQHTQEENKRGFKRKIAFKREPREMNFDGKWEPSSSLSVDFPALNTDEISREISNMYEDVL